MSVEKPGTHRDTTPGGAWNRRACDAPTFIHNAAFLGRETVKLAGFYPIMAASWQPTSSFLADRSSPRLIAEDG